MFRSLCLAIDCNISFVQYSSLNSLFVSTAGQYWVWETNESTLEHWIFPSPLSSPCSSSWQGIECQLNVDGTCSIVRINLVSMNLTGHIPDEIGNITSLQYLNLGSNNIGSSIPDTIGSFPFMTYLRIHDNFLTGSLPTSLFNLTSLEYINLDSNPLTGEYLLCCAFCIFVVVTIRLCICRIRSHRDWKLEEYFNFASFHK